MSAWIEQVRRVLRAATLDVIRFKPGSHPVARRMRLLQRHEVDLVFDVGANAGQYALELRQLGYGGRIVSFEPLGAAFAALRQRTLHDAAWQAVQCAVGDAPGRATINVAGNSASSSLLPMLERHVASAPHAAYVGTEEVAVETLATLYQRHAGDALHPFLKIDVQGYEQRVLAGAGAALDRFVGVQLEMSLVPLYDGELLLPDMIKLLESRGFTLMNLEPGFADAEGGQLLQVDGIFFRGPRH